jgi:CMP-N-acetylneuraminic acid synthetase
MEFFEGMGERFDVIFSVQPTNPLTKHKTLAIALELIEQTDCDSVVTITKILHLHPFRAYRYDSNNMRIQPLTEYTKESFLQKQDRPDAYGMTGAVFGRKSYLLRRWEGTGFALGKRKKGIVVSQEEALDIDTVFDMDVFRGIIALRKHKN